MNAWRVYMVRCSDSSLYTGISTNVERRIVAHNAGKGAAYTRSRKPVALVWKSGAVSESRARKREMEIKKWTKREKEIFIKKKFT